MACASRGGRPLIAKIADLHCASAAAAITINGVVIVTAFTQRVFACAVTTVAMACASRGGRPLIAKVTNLHCASAAAAIATNGVVIVTAFQTFTFAVST
jgi:hypothetical protein